MNQYSIVADNVNQDVAKNGNDVSLCGLRFFGGYKETGEVLM